MATQVSISSTGLNSHARELVSPGQADEVDGDPLCRVSLRLPSEGALSSHGPPSQGGATSCQEHASLTSLSFLELTACTEPPLSIQAASTSTARLNPRRPWPLKLRCTKMDCKERQVACMPEFAHVPEFAALPEPPLPSHAPARCMPKPPSAPTSFLEKPDRAGSHSVDGPPPLPLHSTTVRSQPALTEVYDHTMISAMSRHRLAQVSTAQGGRDPPGALDAGAVSGPLGGLLASAASTLEPPTPANICGAQASAQRVALRVVSLPSLPTQLANSKSGPPCRRGARHSQRIDGDGECARGSALAQSSVLYVALIFLARRIRLTPSYGFAPHGFRSATRVAGGKCTQTEAPAHSAVADFQVVHQERNRPYGELRDE